MKTRRILWFILLVAFIVFFYFVYKVNGSATSKFDVQNTVRPSGVQVSYSAWVPTWREMQSIESINAMKTGIKEIMPVWYTIDENGKVHEQNSDYKKELIFASRSKGIYITPTITNVTESGFDPARVSLLLNKEEDSVSDIVSLVIENDYYGVDLDLEEISGLDRNRYSAFISNLANSLHNRNKKLSVTLHAQDGSSDWIGSKGQDIDEISIGADVIRVMAYDFHNSSTEPGPITPRQELINTISYFLSKTSKDKITICLPTYGYDWSVDKAVPVTYQEAIIIAEKNNSSINKDNDSGEMYFSYLDKGEIHKVWFQNSKSMEKKVDIVKSYGISNICFWSLGAEDPSFWSNI